MFILSLVAAEKVQGLPGVPRSGAALRAGHGTLSGHGHCTTAGRDGLLTFLGWRVWPSLVGLLGTQGSLVHNISFANLVLEEVAYDGGRRLGHGHLGGEGW